MSSGLGIRTASDEDREWLAEVQGAYLEPGTLVVADASTVYGLLFAELDGAHRVSARTARVALFSVAVEGVPDIHVEEALWMCAELLN